MARSSICLVSSVFAGLCGCWTGIWAGSIRLRHGGCHFRCAQNTVSNIFQKVY
jgi:hypothetical protein